MAGENFSEGYIELTNPSGEVPIPMRQALLLKRIAEASAKELLPLVPEEKLLKWLKEFVAEKADELFAEQEAEKKKVDAEQAALKAKHMDEAFQNLVAKLGLKPDIDWAAMSKKATRNLASKPVDAKELPKTSPKPKSKWVGLAKGLPPTNSKDEFKAVNPPKHVKKFQVPVSKETETPEPNRQTSVYWLFTEASEEEEGIRVHQPKTDTFYKGFFNGKPFGWFRYQDDGSAWNSPDDGNCFFVCPKDIEGTYAVTVEADVICLYEWHYEKGYYVPTTLDKVVNGLGIRHKPSKTRL